MSRLGGAAAVAPLVADMSSEVKYISNLQLASAYVKTYTIVHLFLGPLLHIWRGKNTS